MTGVQTCALPICPTPLEQAEALEQLRVLEHGYRIKLVKAAHRSIGVDTPEDLVAARNLIEDRPYRNETTERTQDTEKRH